MPHDRTPPSPQSLLPVRPMELLILTMLAAGERHGYGIRQDILDHTGGAMRLEAGNLYRSIRRLSDLGLVDESDRRPALAADDERRRYYRLTPFGRTVAQAEVRRLESLVAQARAKQLFCPTTRRGRA